MGSFSKLILISGDLKPTSLSNNFLSDHSIMEKKLPLCLGMLELGMSVVEGCAPAVAGLVKIRERW
jgi:hypothetical protein